jgi:hypothetical protein
MTKTITLLVALILAVSPVYAFEVEYDQDWFPSGSAFVSPVPKPQASKSLRFEIKNIGKGWAQSHKSEITPLFIGSLIGMVVFFGILAAIAAVSVWSGLTIYHASGKNSGVSILHTQPILRTRNGFKIGTLRTTPRLGRFNFRGVKPAFSGIRIGR